MDKHKQIKQWVETCNYVKLVDYLFNQCKKTMHRFNKDHHFFNHAFNFNQIEKMPEEKLLLLDWSINQRELILFQNKLITELREFTSYWNCISDYDLFRSNLKTEIESIILKSKGFVYISKIGDHYKVGFTKKEPQQRMTSLNNASLVQKPVLVLAQPCYMASNAELLIHGHLKKYDFFVNKEFFNGNLCQIIFIIKFISSYQNLIFSTILNRFDLSVSLKQ